MPNNVAPSCSLVWPLLGKNSTSGTSYRIIVIVFEGFKVIGVEMATIHGHRPREFLG